MFRSLIHFEFIFVYGVRKCSSFILLQVVDQFSQHHLLKRWSFLHCIFLPPLSKIRCPQVYEFIWAFYFVPLIYISVFVPIPYCLDDCGFVRSDQIRSVAQSCLTLCDPMNHSTPGLPVHHQLPEFTQTHIRRASDAIQPSHPLSSPSPLAPNPSQHQSLFQWVNSLHEVAKVLEFQL